MLTRPPLQLRVCAGGCAHQEGEVGAWKRSHGATPLCSLPDPAVPPQDTDTPAAPSELPLCGSPVVYTLVLPLGVGVGHGQGRTRHFHSVPSKPGTRELTLVLQIRENLLATVVPPLP